MLELRMGTWMNRKSHFNERSREYKNMVKKKLKRTVSYYLYQNGAPSSLMAHS